MTLNSRLPIGIKEYLVRTNLNRAALLALALGLLPQTALAQIVDCTANIIEGEVEPNSDGDVDEGNVVCLGDDAARAQARIMNGQVDTDQDNDVLPDDAMYNGDLDDFAPSSQVDTVFSMVDVSQDGRNGGDGWADIVAVKTRF